METNNSELLYAIALTKIKGIGSVYAKRLIEELGSASELFGESPQLLMKIPRIGSQLATAVQSKELLAQAEKELLFIDRNHIDVFYWRDEKYPYRLRNCEDAPLLFFHKGNVDLNSPHVISVVGTRSASPYGKDICRRLLNDLATALPDLVVVSGLAYGIDITAHREALENGLATIGVLAHGLDRIYPESHRREAARMVEKGALITEYTSGNIPEKGNFLARNRIIAGLCDALVLVESSDKGGAIVTANIADTYGRDVFAFPGRINDLHSMGCNRLIRQNRAALISGADDLIEMMNWKTGTIPKSPQLTLSFDLSEEEQTVLSLIEKQGEVRISSLLSETEIPVSKLTGILLELEFRKIIRSYPGSLYRMAL